MNTNLYIVLGLLAACVVLFIRGKPRADVVALLALLILPLTQIISVKEALTGFSDANVILIAAIFVIGEGLVRTGVAYRIGEWLVSTAGKSEARLLVLLMLSVAGLGSVMSSTGVVAIFIPVVLNVCARMKIAPGRLMMPLSFAGLISGMLTLVGTAPNLVVDQAVKDAGYTGLSFFSFTPIGVTVLVLAVGYMLVASRWLGSSEQKTAAPGEPRRTLLDMIRDYRLENRALRLKVQPDSLMIGKPLSELKLRKRYKSNIIGVERHDGFRAGLLEPTAFMELAASDVLLVAYSGGPNEFPNALAELKLEQLPQREGYFTDQSHQVGMAEIVIPPESVMAGKTIVELEFRHKHGLTVIGLRRNGQAFEGNLFDEKLKTSDILLVTGTWKDIRLLQTQRRDFLVLMLPAEIDDVAPAASQAPFAFASLTLMVVLMVTGVVPNVLAALIACLAMIAFKCIDIENAYRSIQWQSLIVIVGMMPFALALEKTGAVSMAVSGLMSTIGSAGPHAILACLFVMTSLTGLFISNTATAVLMAPIALSLAKELGVSPLPFAMTVALAASAAFMTPVSSPVNTLVVAPGQYKFGDFVKIGVPFTILVLIVTVLLVPMLFPFK